MIENPREFAEVSLKSFRNRASKRAEDAERHIKEGEYSAAMTAIADAMMYDAIAREYELVLEAI